MIHTNFYLAIGAGILLAGFTVRFVYVNLRKYWARVEIIKQDLDQPMDFAELGEFVEL